MKAELINPFIESISELFSMMLNAKAERGKITATRDECPAFDVAAMIGISGESKGTVAILLPSDTAIGIVGRLMGMEFEEVDDTVKDGLAEVVNIVAGGAKARLSGDKGEPMSLGLPSVVTGSNYQIEHPKGSIWLEVPFESDLGALVMRVTFDQVPVTA